MKSLHTDVVAPVERRCISPQWPAEASPGYLEDLTEPGEEMQPTFDRLICGLDPEAAIGLYAFPRFQTMLNVRVSFALDRRPISTFDRSAEPLRSGRFGWPAGSWPRCSTLIASVQ